MKFRFLFVSAIMFLAAVACAGNKPVDDGIIHITSFSISQSSVTLEKGKTFQLTPQFTPTYAMNKNVVWESENTSVATISNTGLITALKTGEAVVTATCEDGEITCPCRVTVIDGRKQVRPSGTGWKNVKVADGITLYTFQGVDPVSKLQQYVCVADVDTSLYQLHFCYEGRQLTSKVFSTKNAIISMNGAYEPESIFIKVDGKVYQKTISNEISSTGVANWKNDGGVALKPNGEICFMNTIFRTADSKGSGSYGESLAEQRTFYRGNESKYTSIYSSAPLLIWDYDPVGTNFVPANVNPKAYTKSEHPYHHQGYTHPRTVVAMDCKGRLLMLVGDGRYSDNAVGWSARDLTNFLVKNFDPQYALNMDGGGSTCMCVQNNGNSTTHIVNHPCDSGSWDSPGERAVTSHFYLLKK